MKKILNVGCGIDDYGTHFVDLFPQRKNVIKCNLDNQKLPFPNNFFDEVYSKNLFEHLTNLGFAIGRTHLGGYEKAKLWSKSRISEDRHYELFTDWHLQNYAKKAGFRNTITEYLLEEAENQNNLIGIKGKMVKLFSLVVRNTPLKRTAYNLVKLEAIK